MVGLLDPLSELFDVLVERGSFVVHVLETADQRLAGMFASAYPVDPFEEVDTVDGEFGPVISGTRHTLGCRLVGSEELGFQMLVRGRVEALEIVADAGQPLVRYRGRYRKLSPEALKLRGVTRPSLAQRARWSSATGRVLRAPMARRTGHHPGRSTERGGGGSRAIPAGRYFSEIA